MSVLVAEPNLEVEDSLEESQIASTGLRRIRIENVQSIAELTLDFDEKGVYRLVGDNDVGKSAILRAIKALFHNVSRMAYKEYISDWADTFVVEGWFYDGGYVKLSRGASDYYEWSIPESGDTLIKTDGKVPEVLQEYFNLYHEQDKSKMNLNFNLQGDKLPFVDNTDSDNYWLTQKALGTNNLLKASKYLKDETRDLNKSIKKTLETIDYEERLCETIVNELLIDNERLETLETNMSVIDEEFSSLTELNSLLEKENTIAEMKQEFENIPVISEQELVSLKEKATKHHVLSNYLSHKKRVESFTEQTEEIDSKIENLALVDSLKESYKKLELLNKYLGVLTRFSIENKALETLEQSIIPEETMIELNQIKDKILLMKNSLSLETKVSEYQTGLDKIDLAYSAKELEIVKLKEEEKVCPLCGSDMMITHTH